jgi:hypothetical protein
LLALLLERAAGAGGNIGDGDAQAAEACGDVQLFSSCGDSNVIRYLIFDFAFFCAGSTQNSKRKK